MRAAKRGDEAADERELMRAMLLLLLHDDILVAQCSRLPVAADAVKKH